MLIPIGHERTNVQRLPWVTFTLVALNILVYLVISIAGVDEESLTEKHSKCFNYLSAHPYLQIPHGLQAFLSSQDTQTLEDLKQAVDTSKMSEDTIAEEQQQFETLAAEFLAAYNNMPIQKYGYIPATPHFLNLFTSLFLHVDFFHLLGNMLFLYLAGCAVEDVWGRPLFAGFYFASGIVATLVHQWKFPDSAVVMVGASGAIAGVMGAFLVRLGNTKIRFAYWLWWYWRGTFNAPAYVMLPLWFILQLLSANYAGQEAGVAFWAHVGGFVFGMLFALAVNMLRIEQKYVAPEIAKSVSLVQTPDFVQATEYSAIGDYPKALVLLQRAIRKEPGNLDAYMEMRRIGEVTRDPDGYTKATAAFIDALIRNKDQDLLLDTLGDFRKSELQKTLPARTLFALGGYFEEMNEELGAVHHYEQLVESYPEDPLAMKAYAKLARTYMERMQDRDKAIQAFRKANEHSNSDVQWRAVLATQMKRYGISERDFTSGGPAAVAAAPTTKADPGPKEDQMLSLPSVVYDGPHENWNIVTSRIERLALKGIHLSNANQAAGMLVWKRISRISVAKIKGFDLVLDLHAKEPGGKTILYRITGKSLSFAHIFPGVDQSFEDAWENMIGILGRNSGAPCFPNAERCRGPVFFEYAILKDYDAAILEAFGKDSIPAGPPEIANA